MTLKDKRPRVGVGAGNAPLKAATTALIVPAAPKNSQSRQARTKAFLARLIAEYPVFAEHQPLAIGVHLPLQAAMPDTSKALIRRALAMHCSCQRCLRVIVDATDRYALDGSVCGAVTEPQREAAKEKLLRAAAKERQKESPAESAPIHLSQTPAPKPTARAYPILRLKRR